ncbi:Hydroxyacylglutathione hydrolase cytoplasmic, partial [Mucuna pruriens]
MKIYHVPYPQDNYSYLIVDESTKEGAVVDPVEPEKVLEAANSHGKRSWLLMPVCKFCAIIYDSDHARGNEKIKQLVPGIKVYGGSIDNVKGCTDKVENGDKVSLGADINILSLHTP